MNGLSRITRVVALLIAPFWITPVFANDQCQNNTTFNVGASKYDITGPAAEEGMMGYGMINQKTAGLLQRLYARAFVIESPCNGRRVVFVNADLGQIFQGVKQQVVLKLKKKYGARYTDQNILLTATHTHSGPGGYSTDAFYNLTTLGFSRENFNVIVEGIVSAIEQAEKNRQPATIKWASGDLKNISFNRSPDAYLQNPLTERNQYANDVDTQMTLIRFDTLSGQPIGLINWFPIHGVSLNNKNHLISPDNKGYAEYVFEKSSPAGFVAAFAQANAGDVSPNAYGHEGGEGAAGIAAIEAAGYPQYAFAKKLYERAETLVRGGVDDRHQFVAMDEVRVAPEWTNGVWQRTCPGALGVSMLAGTQDGEGVGYQGMTCDHLGSVFKGLVCEMTSTTCQGAKPIAITTSAMQPHPWTPQILPFQLLKVGEVVMVAAPAELTTMAGRRIKQTIETVLPHSKVVLSTLANAYAGYVTTHEEYDMQRYEGASTHFGPWELSAMMQIFHSLAIALRDEKAIAVGPTPEDLSASQINMQTGVVFDDKPFGKNFGDVKQDIQLSYRPGEQVEVVFWGGHPKNNARIGQTFLKVQQLENKTWKTIRTDNDWDTEYHWARSGIAESLVTIVWRIPKDMAPGQYRIIHEGEWKSGWSHRIYTYAGTSSVFFVAR